MSRGIGGAFVLARSRLLLTAMFWTSTGKDKPSQKLGGRNDPGLLSVFKFAHDHGKESKLRLDIVGAG